MDIMSLSTRIKELLSINSYLTFLVGTYSNKPDAIHALKEVKKHINERIDFYINIEKNEEERRGSEATSASSGTETEMPFTD